MCAELQFVIKAVAGSTSHTSVTQSTQRTRKGAEAILRAPRATWQNKHRSPQSTSAADKSSVHDDQVENRATRVATATADRQHCSVADHATFVMTFFHQMKPLDFVCEVVEHVFRPPGLAQTLPDIPYPGPGTVACVPRRPLPTTTSSLPRPSATTTQHHLPRAAASFLVCGADWVWRVTTIGALQGVQMTAFTQPPSVALAVAATILGGTLASAGGTVADAAVAALYVLARPLDLLRDNHGAAGHASVVHHQKRNISSLRDKGDGCDCKGERCMATTFKTRRASTSPRRQNRKKEMRRQTNGPAWSQMCVDVEFTASKVTFRILQQA